MRAKVQVPAVDPFGCAIFDDEHLIGPAAGNCNFYFGSEWYVSGRRNRAALGGYCTHSSHTVLKGTTFDTNTVRRQEVCHGT